MTVNLHDESTENNDEIQYGYAYKLLNKFNEIKKLEKECKELISNNPMAKNIEFNIGDIILTHDRLVRCIIHKSKHGYHYMSSDGFICNCSINGLKQDTVAIITKLSEFNDGLNKFRDIIK